MTSKVQISKLALQHVGDRYDIADLDEESVEAEQINLVYDDVRRQTLRMMDWRFATKFVKPAQLSLDDDPPANWTYAFQYPSDAIRIIKIENPLGRDLDPIEFETAMLSDNTRVILTDEEQPEFRYTSDIEDTTRFDAEFVMAFSFMLASRVAMSLTGDPNIKEALRQDAIRELAGAASSSANEGRTKKAPEASWIDARGQETARGPWWWL